MSEVPFTKENLDQYLKELAKEFRKRNGKAVTGEYLVAMKLMSGRKYKYDLSDVIGILWEQEKKGSPFGLEQIKKASAELYGSYDKLPSDSRAFIESAVLEGKYGELYNRIRQMEAENKEILIEYQERKPGVMNSDNVNSILEAIRKKRSGE